MQASIILDKLHDP